MQHVGMASIYGIDGRVAYVGVATLLGDGIINDVSITDDFSSEFLYNKNGNPTGVKISNRQLHVDIAFTPIGQTTSAAKTMTTLIDPYSRVRLSNFPLTFNGLYNYRGGLRITQSNKGRTVMIIPLIAFPDGASAYEMSSVSKKDV